MQSCLPPLSGPAGEKGPRAGSGRPVRPALRLARAWLLSTGWALTGGLGTSAHLGHFLTV